jgi:hypothetical protein
MFIGIIRVVSRRQDALMAANEFGPAPSPTPSTLAWAP